MKMLVFWRTALVVMFLALVMLAALFFCAHWHLSSDYFDYAVKGCVGLAIAAVTHGSVTHLAGDGGGVWGSVKALFTSAKPEQPAVQQ